MFEELRSAGFQRFLVTEITEYGSGQGHTTDTRVRCIQASTVLVALVGGNARQSRSTTCITVPVLVRRVFLLRRAPRDVDVDILFVRSTVDCNTIGLRDTQVTL